MGCSGAPAAADRPAYRKLSYDEDWSVLADPALRTDLLDALKYLPFAGGEAYLSLGGSLRERYSGTRDPQWGDGGQGADDSFQQRYVLHADLHAGRLRFYGEASSALIDGQRGPPGPVDENALDLQQAFADLRFDAGGLRWTLRGGREELAFGSSRLVDVREGPNVRRKFDGLRATLKAGAWQTDLLLVRPARVETGRFDDRTDRSQALWGFYSAGPARVLPGTLDLYYLGYENRHGVYVQEESEEIRHSLGGRWSGEAGGWDWNTEAIVQLGHVGDGEIRAWTVASDTGHTWNDVPGSPRLGLSANVASGDRDPRDRDLQTFNPLFPRGNYFSELSLLGPRNFYNLHPFLTLRPLDRITITTDLDCFWRLERGDGIYAPGGQLLRSGEGTGASYVGTEYSLNLGWQPSAHLEFTAVYAHFFPGAFIRESGGARAIDFLELTMKAVF